ncbi:MAG: hypothetical protein FJ144_23895 [Deltaproteobacteria bacterium]|nr:hypothetical protein [Deltaproteobacteria bacterium]
MTKLRAAERIRARPIAAAFALALLAAGCEPADGPRRIRAHPLPTGAVEFPRDGEVVGKFIVEGWALADDGIDEVNVYLDGAWVGTALSGIHRPDVATAFPDVPGVAASGFRLTIDSAESGEREIVVQARSRRGATRDIASRRIRIVGR